MMQVMEDELGLPFMSSFSFNGLTVKQLHTCARGQLRQTLCHPKDYIPPGSSVHKILQAEYWSGLPFPPPGDLPESGIKPASPVSPAFPSLTVIWDHRRQ